jgi:hypothetical protein
MLSRVAARNCLDAGPPSATIKQGRGLVSWTVVMPVVRRVIPKTPPIGQRRCPACGLRLFLVAIDPTGVVGEDERVFECAECAYAETVIVQLR